MHCKITVKNKADYFADFTYRGLFLERIPRDKRGFTVLKKSEEVKSKLKESLSGALVSIKFDGVTRLRSRFLGIAVQYCDEEHGLTIKTLTLVDTEANHTSFHLKEILLDTLKQFNISKQQVLACVVDNGSNMTRT